MDLAIQTGKESYIHYANLNNIELNLPESGYTASLENLTLDYDQSVSLSNLMFKKDSLSTKAISARVRAALLSGFDQSKIWRDKKFKADSLHLIQPKINLTLVIDSIADKEKKPLISI